MNFSISADGRIFLNTKYWHLRLDGCQTADYNFGCIYFYLEPKFTVPGCKYHPDEPDPDDIFF
jgi:hypothetical protein